ncbi:hypothetical protein PFICI_04686 [Pestalotiopsis fici W106-1]|uniref:Ketoreductase (KR) domain-containing protein n=1 Tax=Pestalotiopsis fici (strain W106-1 / CGMCC3.15140) TaxID=1229662 RepID=W3X9S9_PESFW|nr:uncharacterized protein PFICI_04686 [Pestalotiopsis fici W106-1]ETS82810.1 hypothetical protein PFICI_04686 [Pestalotiopsis fici W106-1]
MVNLDIVRKANAELVKRQPLVAIFIGGTAGIGEFGAQGLARTHGNEGKGLRLYIVGRNRAAAEEIISSCLQLWPHGQFIFIAAENLALLKDVDQVCAAITARERDEATRTGQEPRIDFLVMTQGLLNLKRKDTQEGLDETMSLAYYSRMRCIVQLLPLLLQSSLPARVVSVWNPTFERDFATEDISCRRPENATLRRVSSQVANMTAFFLEELAKRHPGKLALVHLYPGFVNTNFGQNAFPAWFNFLYRYLAMPLIRWTVAITPEETGDRITFLATDRYPARGTTPEQQSKTGNGIDVAMAADNTVGGGFYRVNKDSEILPPSSFNKELRERGIGGVVWRHTMAAFETIASGQVFED